MNRTLKNKKGFTLTELIVVIVIIGILAAVLIPTLTGYINRAKQSAAEQEAGAYVTAYNAYLVEKEVDFEGTFAEYCVSMDLDDYTPTENADENGFTIEIDGYEVTYTTAAGLTSEAK